MSWPDFTKQYHSEMASKQPLIADARTLADQGDLTLLCSCKDEHRCYRTLLKVLVEAESTP